MKAWLAGSVVALLMIVASWRSGGFDAALSMAVILAIVWFACETSD